MLFEEWDWENYAAAQRQEGIALGKKSALKSAIWVIAGLFPPEEIAKRFNVHTNFVMSALNNA